MADAVVAAGAEALIVHARKAWLKGLSPRENRDVPPLDHAQVFALKTRLPHIPIVLNGGLTSWTVIEDSLPQVDGVMLGRAAYGEPAILLDVDRRLFGETRSPPTRIEVIEAYLPYVDTQLRIGVPLHAMTRHMLGLFNGVPGGSRVAPTPRDRGRPAGCRSGCSGRCLTTPPGSCRAGSRLTPI